VSTNKPATTDNRLTARAATFDQSRRNAFIKYEILIVDDHPLYRDALRRAVAAACPESDMYEAESVAGLFDALERHPRTDLLLLDLNLPGAYGFSALAHLRGSRPELPVIVVSAMDDPHVVRQALAFGAQGFVSKCVDAAAIGRDVLAVLRGEVVSPHGLGSATGPVVDVAALDVAQRMAQLTPQQFRVFGMLCSGMLNKQIAYDMQITEPTVKAHMSAILRKLGAVNRTQAVLLAGHLVLDPSELKPAPEGIGAPG
jgi:DNA-binding NarL/FixJ family response regulator